LLEPDNRPDRLEQLMGVATRRLIAATIAIATGTRY
jgi:hypothetical protein